MDKQDKEKLTSHVERNRIMTEITMFGRTADVEVVPSDRLLDFIEDLSCPVKVPQFVAEWIEWCRNYKWALSNVIDASNIQYFEDHNRPTGLTSWFVKKGHDEIIARAWLDGYEVEEEPRWVVKMATGYFMDFEEGCNEEGFEWVSSSKSCCLVFTDKSKAEAVATLVDGSVQEV